VTHKIGQTVTDTLRQYNLSPAQLDVLAQVGRHEGLTQQDLADRLLVTKGNVCQLLGRMETAGLLVRRPEGGANHLFLTQRGRDLYAEVMPVHEALVADLLSPLSAEGQRDLISELRQLDRTLGDAPIPTQDV
jgi:DNA-binding MarR family transcriptional regulator